MKNSFKLGFVALVIAVSAAACSGNAKKEGGDTTTVKVDSTVKKDSTVVKVDSTAKKDTTAGAAKADTTKK